MNFNFSEKINNLLKIIAKNAQENNKRVFFVGGIVRDALLGVEILDIDLLLEGNAIEFAQTLLHEIEIKSIHKEFCTVKIAYQGIEVDIASSRKEKYLYSGSLPVVDEVGVTIEEDVLRRDFSVNSLYAQILLEENELKFEFIDYVGGKNDILNKKLNVLHPKSYIDDPTRIIRGLGFKYRFGFDFSLEDKKLIEQYLNEIDYSNMSIDRNIKVIKKALALEFQDEIFREIIENAYYKIINKNDLEVNFEFLRKVLSIFNLSCLEKANFYVQVILNSCVEKLECNDILAIYKDFSKYKNIDLAYYFYKTNDENVLKFLEIKDIKIQINGEDLINHGFKQGVQIGKALDYLLVNKLSHPDNFQTKNDELQFVLSAFHEN